MTGSIPSIIFGSVIVLLGGVLFLVIQIVRLKKKVGMFMQGKDASSLEEVLQLLTQKIDAIEETLKAHKEALEYIDNRVKKSIRGYSLVKYNAYGDAGGEQSFASGLLDEEANGYILSIITNRNHVGVYAKKISEGKPDSSLTDEEALALKDAQVSLS